MIALLLACSSVTTSFILTSSWSWRGNTTSWTLPCLISSRYTRLSWSNDQESKNYNTIVQVMREYTSKVDKLEEAENQRATEATEEKNKPIVMGKLVLLHCTLLMVALDTWVLWCGCVCGCGLILKSHSQMIPKPWHFYSFHDPLLISCTILSSLNRTKTLLIFSDTQPQLMLGYAGGAPPPAGAYNNTFTPAGGMPSYQGYSM